MRIHIFANSRLDQADREKIKIAADEQVIAADGGVRHCLELEIRPDLVVGDFDSLSAAELQGLEAAGVELERHPAAKDETDLELALAAAARRGAEQVLVYGALGARWDMSVANLLLLAHPDFQDMDIRLVAGNQTVQLVQGGESLRVEGQVGDLVSLIPLCVETIGVRTEGLEYALHGEKLLFGYTRGISNRLRSRQAEVSLEQGKLLCIHAGNQDDENNRQAAG